MASPNWEEPSVEPELHRFLDQVVFDGRFISDVGRDPQRVALELGFELAPETAEQLRAKPLEEHLDELYTAKFQMVKAAIIIIVAAIVVIIAITIVRYSALQGSQVTDRSAHANAKL